MVLAARRATALEETARSCAEQGGGRAFVVVTDVTSEEQVRALASATLEQFQRIDIWVNNAGVSAFGQLESTPFEPHRRVIETNVYGAMFGARAALPIFRKQGRGILINVGSILSKIGQPYVPSYIISKFALRGLSEALRAEIADQPDIHVCTLLPYAMNTQHFETAANFTGREPHALPPAPAPEEAARALVELAKHPVRERHVPRIAQLGLLLHQLFPRPVERAIHRIVSRWHFGRPERLLPEGNLWQPSRDVPRVAGKRPPRIGLGLLALWFVFGRRPRNQRPQLRG